MRDSSENKMNIVLIRHGQTKNNNERRYCGRRDDAPLAKEGIQNIKEFSERIGYPPAEVIFTSSLIRSKQTAEIIYPNQKYKSFEEFDEMDFGDFEGKSYNDLKDNPEYQKWIDSNGEKCFPNGENKADFCKRVSDGFLKALDKAKDADSIAIVAHGGTIMAILSVFAGENYFECMRGNGGGFLCEMDGNDPYSLKILSKF